MPGAHMKTPAKERASSFTSVAFPTTTEGTPQPENITEKKLSQDITISAMTTVMAKLSKLNIRPLRNVSRGH